MDLFFHVSIFELVKDKFWQYEDLFEKLMIELTEISEEDFLKRYPDRVILLIGKKNSRINIHFRKIDGVYVITFVE